MIAVLVVWQWELLSYGLAQGKGQLKVVLEAKPVGHFLESPDFPDSLKMKLRLVKEIRQFAIDSLGINYTDNYTTLFDQQGEVTLWNLSACEAFELKAFEWHFPLLGSFPYKGFFNLEKARIERDLLRERGYDTWIRPVNGWSTLGWFSDPILSNMLNRSVGNLAELIIHEMTHGTLYIKDSATYNENLASFIGEKGGEKWLTLKYGAQSKEYQEYLAGEDDYRKYVNHFIVGANKLDSLYKGLDKALEKPEMAKLKEEMIQKVIDNLDTVSFSDKQRYVNRFRTSLPNNTYFMSFLRYRSRQGDFGKEYAEHFNSNIKLYLTYLKEKYPSL
ncbi:MAG: aminopeptidase [Cyclobacteriaceae bacterium]